MNFPRQFTSVQKAVAQLSNNAVGMEELTIAHEGWEWSRQAVGELLGSIDPGLQIPAMGPGLKGLDLSRLRRAVERRVLPVRITELSINEE